MKRALFLVLAACGDDDAPMVRGDAALPDAAIASSVDMPELPAMPELPPCGAGFVAAGASCDPPAERWTDCPAGQARFGLDPACVRVGVECPSGAFPEALPDGRPVRYVAPGASDGDGTRARPFARIADALIDAPPRLVIALAKGEHPDVVALPPGVALVGACATETRIVGDETMNPNALVRTMGAGASIENLTVAAGAHAAIGAYGGGASMRVSGVIVERPVLGGLVAFDGGLLEATDVLVVDAGLGSIHISQGAYAAVGSEMRLTRVSFLRGAEVPTMQISDHSRATLADCRVEADPTSAAIGFALVMDGGSTASVTRSALLDNREVFVGGEDTVLEMEDSLVAARFAEPYDDRTSAVVGYSGARIALRHTHVIGNAGRGIVSMYDADVELTDVAVRGPGPVAIERSPQAIIASRASRLTASRVVVERYQQVGVFADDHSRLEASDLSVRDISPNGDRFFGWGISAQNDAQVRLDRVHVERTNQSALTAVFGASIDARDVTIAAITNSPTTVQVGASILVTEAASIVGERFAVTDGEGFGVLASGSETRAELAHASIAGIDVSTCADCDPPRYGIGAAANGGAALELERFAIGSVALCGVHVASGADVRLMSGRITDNPVGVCVETAGYDFDKLMDGVIYEHNTTNLDSTSLPVPSVGGTIEVTFEPGT